ncbi:hypothetical protein, partial [Fusobacterium varium]|uniref:hypothetical protein n=1 Tax=Fusobacterium varium TaxID=856 RepID=UPI002432081C
MTLSSKIPNENIKYLNTENSKTNYNDENQVIPYTVTFRNKISDNYLNKDSFKFFIKYVQQVMKLEKRTMDLKEKLCLRE